MCAQAARGTKSRSFLCQSGRKKDATWFLRSINTRSTHTPPPLPKTITAAALRVANRGAGTVRQGADRTSLAGGWEVAVWKGRDSLSQPGKG